MDSELDIHELIIKLRQLNALIEEDAVVNFELRDRLEKLKKVPPVPRVTHNNLVNNQKETLKNIVEL